jgi:hypothetical protein
MPFDPSNAVPVAAGFDPSRAVPADPQTSQSLGFYEGAMHPFDRAAVALSNIPYVGPAVDRVGAAMGMPSASEAEAAHNNYIAQQKQAGVQPGGIGEFAGNVVATLPAVAGSGPIVGGAIAGGLLSDSNDVGGTVADMIKGAVAGKVGDAVLGGIASASRPITRYVANKISGWTQPLAANARDAAQYVYRLMGENTPDDIRAAATNAGVKPMMGAEAIGRPGITALATLGRRSGTTADMLAGALSERNGAASDRILGDYASAAKIDPAAARGDMDALVQNGRDAASSLYDKALSAPGGVWSKNLADLSNRPVIAKAMKSAADDLRNAGEDPTGYGFTAQDPDTGKFIQAPRPTAAAWDIIKKNVANQVERDPFGKVIPDSVSRGNYNVGVANKDLTASLRTSIPGYGDALDSAGDYLTLNKAFNTGQDFILKPGITAQQVADHVAKLSPAEAQAFKGGIANKLFDTAQNGKLSPTIFDRPIVRQKLVAALGQDDANSFLANMKTEAQLKQSGARMMPGTGSITSDVTNTTGEQNQSADALMDAIYAGAHLAYGNKLGFGTRALSAMRRMGMTRSGGMSEATRNEAGRLLMMNPSDLANHLESLGALANPPSVGRVAGGINAARIPARSGLSALVVAPSGQEATQ